MVDITERFSKQRYTESTKYEYVRERTFLGYVALRIDKNRFEHTIFMFDTEGNNILLDTLLLEV